MCVGGRALGYEDYFSEFLPQHPALAGPLTDKLLKTKRPLPQGTLSCGIRFHRVLSPE